VGGGGVAALPKTLASALFSDGDRALFGEIGQQQRGLQVSRLARASAEELDEALLERLLAHDDNLKEAL
jgi:hypothetical protein